MTSTEVSETAQKLKAANAKKYLVLDLHGNESVAQNQLNEGLRNGWTVVCSLAPNRVLFRNFDDDGNVHQEANL